MPPSIPLLSVSNASPTRISMRSASPAVRKFSAARLALMASNSVVMSRPCPASRKAAARCMPEFRKRSRTRPRSRHCGRASANREGARHPGKPACKRRASARRADGRWAAVPAAPWRRGRARTRPDRFDPPPRTGARAGRKRREWQAWTSAEHSNTYALVCHCLTSQLSWPAVSMRGARCFAYRDRRDIRASTHSPRRRA